MQLESGGTFQSGPLIVDGTMYLTTFHGTYALNPETCATKWHDTYTPRGPEAFNTNRGVAYMNGMLFRGFQDGHLKALDAATGKTLWDVPVGDAKKSEFLSSAPLAWDGMVITGIAGADWGSRGRVMAFDAKTGKQLWRFDLIPQGSEPGADTWGKAETASTGGGSTWTTYTLDPTSGALYVPVGNPAPDFSNQYRPGDNLYTDSIVVLDAHTGKLRWYHQFVANDSHDYDIGAAPALITTSTGKHLVLVGAKNAMLYALDPSTHHGAQLFSAHVPGAMAGGVVTYTQGGKQYVMVESGNTSRTLWSTTGSPNVTIFALRT